jgi:hypothetical protein
MQVTITALKDTERVSKSTGRPFTSRAIKTEEHGDKWLSGFAGKDNASWKVGDTVEIEVEQKGEFTNFSVPKGSFSKTPGSPDLNRVEVKMDAGFNSLRTELQMMKTVLSDILSKIDGSKWDKDDTAF